MSVSFWVGHEAFAVGDASFLKALFSTIFIRAENRDWGSAYPVLMRDLYSGRVSSSTAREAAKELEALRTRLAEHAPSEVVWDFERPESKPPWGDNLSPHISSLANYFVTSDGKDLLNVLSTALSEAMRSGHDLTIR